MPVSPHIDDPVQAQDLPRGAGSASAADILTATERLLARSTLDDLSVDRILEEANVARATFYRHFTSKFGVVAALIKSILDDVIETSRSVSARDHHQDPGAELRRVLTAIVDVRAHHRPVFHAVSEHLHLDSEIRTVWLAFMDRYAQLLADQIESERSPHSATATSDVKQMVCMLLWASERVYYVSERDLDPNMAPPTKLLPHLAQMWLGTWELANHSPPPGTRIRPSADDPARLHELERENSRLRRIVADQALEIQALEDERRDR